MEIGVTDVRRRLRDVLARVEAGDTVTVTRRGRAVAVIAPPSPASDRPLRDALTDWRERWDVDTWPDDGPFADVRAATPGRPDPWS